MKKRAISPYRKSKKSLKKSYTVTIKKAKNGDLLIPIPDDIVKAYGLEVGDVAIWEKVEDNTFIIRFVKKTMYSFVERRC
jgi:hypothetical protein